MGRELEQINLRRSALQARKLSAENQAEVGSLSEAQKSVAGYCKALAKKLHRFTEQERQRFLRFIVREITFEGSRVRITGALPVLPTSPESARADETDHTGKSMLAIGGIAATTSHNYGRNSIFADHRIATPMVYRRGHNSVTEVSFQVSQDLPQPPHPLHQQITSDDLRKLVGKNPAVTLHELCELVQKQRGIEMSTSAMCRLMKRYYIRRKPQLSSLPLAA